MSEFTHHQKTVIVQGLLILLEAEPAELLEEVLALISFKEGEVTDPEPIWIHDMFLVRNNAIELITKFMSERGLSRTTTPERIRNSTLYGHLAGKNGFSLSVPAGQEINVKLDQDSGPIERDFLLRAVVPGFRDGTVESEFDITQDVPNYLISGAVPRAPKVDLNHGITTFSIGDGILARMHQSGKYGYQRLVDANTPTELPAQSNDQHIFNILYPMTKINTTMALQGEIERFLFIDDQTLGNNGPLLSRAGIPRPTRTDAIEYMVHALATKLRTRIVIENYDLKWERLSAYCHCTREVHLKYNEETKRWVVGPTVTFHDDPTLELTPDRAANLVLDMASIEVAPYPHDHPFMDLSLREVLAVASVDDSIGVLAWGPRTLSEPNSALLRNSSDTILRNLIERSRF